MSNTLTVAPAYPQQYARVNIVPQEKSRVKKHTLQPDMPADRAVKKRHRTDTDDNGRKQRGRPRVEGEDETAADRRRTQIRLAQRAYRQRKEFTISNLKEQVTNLRSTVEEMENIFLAYNERAMTSGIMLKNPDLAKDLKAATEAFITLAKNTHSDDDGEQWSGEELEDAPRKPQGTYAHDMATLLGFNANQNVTSSSPEPGLELQGPEDSVMGYNFQDIYNNPRDKKIARTSSPMYAATQGSQLSMMSTTAELIPGFFAATAGLNANPLSVTSGPNALGGMSRQVIPTTPGDRADLLKIKSLAAPYTYSFEESTFARRLQRASIERGFHLITNAETRPSVFLRVFRLSLLYHTREALGMKFQKALSRSTEEPLETFQTPFIHLGGAGMHYNTGRIRNGYIVKPGPLQQRATLESTESPGAVMDIDFDLSDYEGEWFDSNDVEGYLNEKGLFIDPQSSFTEGQISVPNGSTLGSFFNSDSPPANIFDSPSSRPNEIDLHSLTAAGSTASPSTPVMSESAMGLGTQGLFPELGAASPNTLWNNAAADWLMGSGNKTPDFLESGWSSYNKFSSWDMLDAVGMVDGYAPSNIMPEQQTSKKQVTVDVSRFIDELIKTAVCLGRAPGFRKKDVDQALTAAIIQVL